MTKKKSATKKTDTRKGATGFGSLGLDSELETNFIKFLKKNDEKGKPRIRKLIRAWVTEQQKREEDDGA